MGWISRPIVGPLEVAHGRRFWRLCMYGSPVALNSRLRSTSCSTTCGGRSTASLSGPRALSIASAARTGSGSSPIMATWLSPSSMNLKTLASRSSERRILRTKRQARNAECSSVNFRARSHSRSLGSRSPLTECRFLAGPVLIT